MSSGNVMPGFENRWSALAQQGWMLEVPTTFGSAKRIFFMENLLDVRTNRIRPANKYFQPFDMLQRARTIRQFDRIIRSYYGPGGPFLFHCRQGV
jgi:hypothetical protein